MKRLLLTFLAVTGAFALPEGELRFALGGKTYATQHAVALVQKKGEKTRIMIAVKDIDQRFMLMLTADVAKGDELKPLQLTTVNGALALTLRTQQGILAVLPATQLAKPTADTYSERLEVDSGQWEDDVDVDAADDRHRSGRLKKKRRKMRTEYRRVKPQWHQLSREERIRTGEGVIANRAFQDTFFTLTLTPVIQSGKVTAYQGSFSGSGRFSRSISGAEIRQIQDGAFHVRVENAP
ncbi:MAG TPA: hypothetical protein PKD60_13270 [Turneriella sp.]|nr:hypothetical protein [Turneriella sp.]HNL54402.1 hypothetical protein [Turneriella sp.]